MKCRLCGSDETSFVCRMAANMRILGRDFPTSPVDFVVCRHCGNVYADLPITQDEVTSYYRSESAHSLSYYEVYGEAAADAYFSDILHNFEGVIGKDAAIVDVASGIGDFAQFLGKQGYADVHALDCDARSLVILKERGIPAIASDAMTCPAGEAGKYDMALMIHSLEHILSFDKAIETVKQMLKPSGYFYVEVPDAENYCDNEDAPYTMFTYEHTFHLSLDTFDNLARAFGLRLVKKGGFYKADSYHVIWALFRNGGERQPVKYVDSVRAAVAAYDARSKRRAQELVAPLAASGKRLILWGIGASTASMLDGHFDDCDAEMLIDRNPARQDLVFHVAGKDLAIEPPEHIHDDAATIVILPFWYKDSIARQIREMGFQNEVVALS